MTTAERAKLETWKAAIAADFRSRRCPCGAPAVMVGVGHDEVREVGILLKATTADRNRCLEHGLPWKVQGEEVA